MNCELVKVMLDGSIGGVVEQFNADTHEDASAWVEAYLKSHPELTFPGVEYLYRQSEGDFLTSAGLIHKGGVVTHGLSDVDNFFVDWEIERRLKYLRYLKTHGLVSCRRMLAGKYLLRANWLLWMVALVRNLSKCSVARGVAFSCMSVVDWVGCFWRMKVLNPFRGFVHACKRLWYFHRHSQDIQAFWDFDIHFVESLRWNAHRLIHEGHGVPMVFFRADDGYHDNIELALAESRRIYNRMIELAELYAFYCDASLEPIPDHKDAIGDPCYLPNSLVEDYHGMEQKATECWNELLDLFKEYGRYMAD